MWDVDFGGRLPVGDWFPLRFRSLVAQKWRDEVACLILRSPRHSQIYLQELDMIIIFFFYQVVAPGFRLVTYTWRLVWHKPDPRRKK